MPCLTEILAYLEVGPAPLPLLFYRYRTKDRYYVSVGNRNLEHANPHVSDKHSKVNCLLSCKLLPRGPSSGEVGVALACTNCFSTIPAGARLNNTLAEVAATKTTPLFSPPPPPPSHSRSHTCRDLCRRTHPLSMWCETQTQQPTS